MEESLIRRWATISPKWRWLHDPQPISDQPVGSGFPHRPRQYLPGGSPFFVPGSSELLMCRMIYDLGVGSHPHRVQRNSTNPSQSAICPWGWSFRTVRGGIDLGCHRFRPQFDGVADVYIYS